MKIRKFLPLISKKTILEEVLLLSVIMFILLYISKQTFTVRLKDELWTAVVNNERSSAKMCDINVLLKGVFVSVPIFLLVCTGIALMHYNVLRQGPMAVYTMKRIKSSWEVHVRSITLPLIMFVVMLVLSMIYLSVFINTYFSETPAHLLPEYKGVDFWRLFV